MTKQLMTWARSVSGMGKRSGKAEFASQQALQGYLRQHPNADVSKHSVAQNTPKTSSNADASYGERAKDPHYHERQIKMLEGQMMTIRDQLSKHMPGQNRSRATGTLNSLQRSVQDHEKQLEAIGSRKLSPQEHGDKAAAHAAQAQELSRALQEKPKPGVSRSELAEQLHHHQTMAAHHKEAQESHSEESRARVKKASDAAAEASKVASTQNNVGAHTSAALAHKMAEQAARRSGDRALAKSHAEQAKYHDDKAEEGILASERRARAEEQKRKEGFARERARTNQYYGRR